jgi:hypothetical protein
MDAIQHEVRGYQKCPEAVLSSTAQLVTAGSSKVWSGSKYRLLNEIQELVAGFAVALEVAQHAAGDGATVLFLHAAHHHAEVIGLNDYADAFGLQVFFKSVSHVGGQSLLHLKSAAEDVDHAGNLAQPDDLLVGEIGNVTFSVKGEKMVLAEAVDFDVFDDDHLVILGFKNGAVDHLFDIQLISLGQELQTRLDALGCSLEPVPIDIFPQLDQDLLDEIGDPFGHIRFLTHARTASPPSLPISL